MQELNNHNFNHLKIHTQYSICEGAIKIEKLKDFCKENKIPCVGLSDTSNLCGALEFAEKISKVGTQPIIGTQINFKYGEIMGLLPLYALNEDGYKTIIELSSMSFLKNDELSDPHLNIDELLKIKELLGISQLEQASDSDDDSAEESDLSTKRSFHTDISGSLRSEIASGSEIGNSHSWSSGETNFTTTSRSVVDENFFSGVIGGITEMLIGPTRQQPKHSNSYYEDETN